jgi:hypothetical protein
MHGGGGAMTSSLDLDALLAPAGPAAESFAQLWQSLWRQPYVSAELLELCRLTLARLHGDALELAAVQPRAPEGERCSQRRRAVLEGEALQHPSFSAGERAVLLFAECYWGDARSIPDDVADAVKADLGEPGLVFLIQALGCLDGRIRSARCLRDLAAAQGGSA